MSFITELRDYMESNGIGTKAVDLFVGRLPAEPDTCVMVKATGGAIPQHEVRELQYPTFQVIARGATYPLAEAKIEAVRELLHGKFNITLPSYTILRVHASGEAGHIGTDATSTDAVGRDEFSCNFYAEIRAN